MKRHLPKSENRFAVKTATRTSSSPGSRRWSTKQWRQRQKLLVFQHSMFDRLGDPYQIWCIMMYALFIFPSKFLNKPLLALGYRYLHLKPWHFRCFNPKNWGPRLNPFTMPRARCRSPMWCWRSCCWDPSICMETQGTVLKWWYPKIIQNLLLPMIFNGKNPMVLLYQSFRLF